MTTFRVSTNPTIYIGKSLFLPYLLARRLQERQPVALQTGKHIALFDEQGVRFYPADDEASRYFLPRGTWILSDSSQEGDPEPCRAFRRPKPGVHTIYISSPDSRHWKGWAKHRSAIKFFMDVWSPKEFEKLLYVLSFSPYSTAKKLPGFFTNTTLRTVSPSFRNLGQALGPSSVFSEVGPQKPGTSELSAQPPPKSHLNSRHLC